MIFQSRPAGSGRPRTRLARPRQTAPALRKATQKNPSWYQDPTREQQARVTRTEIKRTKQGQEVTTQDPKKQGEKRKQGNIQRAKKRDSGQNFRLGPPCQEEGDHQGQRPGQTRHEQGKRAADRGGEENIDTLKPGQKHSANPGTHGPHPPGPQNQTTRRSKPNKIHTSGTPRGAHSTQQHRGVHQPSKEQQHLPS